MRNKFYGIVMVSIFTITMGWNINQDETNVTLSDIVLSNVEALARNESISDCIIANCRWEEGKACHYTCNGTDYMSSNMYNK